MGPPRSSRFEEWNSKPRKNTLELFQRAEAQAKLAAPPISAEDHEGNKDHKDKLRRTRAERKANRRSSRSVSASRIPANLQENVSYERKQVPLYSADEALAMFADELDFEEEPEVHIMVSKTKAIMVYDNDQFFEHQCSIHERYGRPCPVRSRRNPYQHLGVHMNNHLGGESTPPVGTTSLNERSQHGPVFAESDIVGEVQADGAYGTNSRGGAAGPHTKKRGRSPETTFPYRQAYDPGDVVDYPGPLVEKRSPSPWGRLNDDDYADEVARLIAESEEHSVPELSALLNARAAPAPAAAVGPPRAQAPLPMRHTAEYQMGERLIAAQEQAMQDESLAGGPVMQTGVSSGAAGGTGVGLDARYNGMPFLGEDGVWNLWTGSTWVQGHQLEDLDAAFEEQVEQEEEYEDEEDDEVEGEHGDVDDDDLYGV